MILEVIQSKVMVDGMRLFQNIFNPFNYSEDSNDVVAEEILRLGYNMPKLRENLNGDINLKFFKNKDGVKLLMTDNKNY